MSLKTANIQVDGINVEITELNGLAQIEMMEERRRLGDDAPELIVNMRCAAIMFARCVVGWEGTPEDVLKRHRLETVLEVATKINELSERGSKNSESAPNEDSSSG